MMTPRQERQAKLAMQRARPALTSGAGAIGTTSLTGGMGGADSGGEIFLAEITAVSGEGTAAKYGFVEQNVGTPSGVTGERVSGRRGTPTGNPGRFASVGTLNIGDLVLIRRNVADVNEYEILSVVGPGNDGSSGGPPAFSFVAHRNPRCEGENIVYDEVTINLYGSVFGEEV